MATTRLVRRLGRKLSRSKRSSRSRSLASSNTEDAPLGSQKNPLHVLTRDTPVGWAVIQKAVDDFDKDQIEGVKNDIDTLLVFIGLFSAVLSAFLVVAVALLQEDVPTATLTTLRQMSVQNANYTIQGNFIHSTSPAPTSFTQFEPTANAIRINDLWTASLLISLITASFGILVKQWLREYMKFVTSFPQGRLRIRKFRRAGLETWKVLTIAACLPLLLQLALGIFFVGLCFYTAELHSSVRNTTLPLVAGWGFIFLFVTISPLFSAHCPYKTPALDSLVVAVRRSARMQWKALLGGISTRAMSISWDPSLRGRMAKVICDWTTNHFNRLDAPTDPYDEATAAKHEPSDLDIMVAADELQGNDEIVGTAMADALQHITATSEDVIWFLLRILQHRIPWEGNFNSEPQVIDCSMATTRALDSIHSILEKRLRINDILIPSDTSFKSGPVASWTAALYLSLWTHRGFENVHAPPWESLNMRPEIFAAVAVSTPSALGLEVLLRLTCHRCRDSKLDLAQSTAQIKSVVEHSFRKLRLTDSFDPAYDNGQWRKVLNRESLRDTVKFLTDLLHSGTIAQDCRWSDAQHDVLPLIFKLIAVDPWTSPESIQAVQRLIALLRSDAAEKKLLTPLIKSYLQLSSWYINPDLMWYSEALSHFTPAIEAIATTSPDQLTRPSVLKTCRALAEGVYDARTGITNMGLTESWRGIFAALTSLVQATPVPDDDTGNEAWRIDWCFHWLSGVDALNEDLDRKNNEKYLIWRETFKPEESPIPDGFYLALMHISTPEDPYWRVRRLQEMTVEDREAAAKDVERYLRKPSPDNLNDHAASLATGRGEGSGVGAGAGTGTGRAVAPGEAEQCGNSGNDWEIVAEGLEPDANVVPVSSDGCGPTANIGRGDEQDAQSIEEAEIASRDSEAVKFPATHSPGNAQLPQAETIGLNPSVLEGEHGERGLEAGIDLADENILGDTLHRFERAL